MKIIGIGTEIKIGTLTGTVKFINTDHVLIELGGRLQRFSFAETEKLFGV